MTTWAYGLDTGTDSFWVQIDAGDRIGFHIPIGEFGPSSDAHTKDTPTPNITLAKGGRHRITISLRENPGVMLDRVTFHDMKGKLIAEVQAESAPEFAPNEIDMGPTQDFYVVGDGSAAAKFVDRDSNVGLKIRKLWQRKSARLEAGQSLTVSNLLYDDTSDARAKRDLRRVSESAALIVGPKGPEALVGVGGLQGPDALQTDAHLFMMTPTAVRLVDCTKWGAWLNADAPVSVEIDLAARTVRPSRGTRLALTLPDGAFDAASQAVREMLSRMAQSASGEARRGGEGGLADATTGRRHRQVHPGRRRDPAGRGGRGGRAEGRVPGCGGQAAVAVRGARDGQRCVGGGPRPTWGGALR
jgi:hypothetical protein